MTNYKEHIKIVDGTIAQINANIGYSGNLKQRGDALKQFALIALNKIGSSEIIISSIKEIDFPPEDLPFGGLYNTQDIREENKKVAYRQSVKALVGILEQERERLVKEQQEKAQLENVRLQKESIKWAKIAAFAGIASIIVTIILYLCKN